MIHAITNPRFPGCFVGRSRQACPPATMYVSSSHRKMREPAVSGSTGERRMRTYPRLMTLILGLTLAGSAADAGQAHPGEYAPADIAYGSRLYDAQCTTCHGANGDGVGGVDLKSGRFRNAVTDQDLVRVITTGIQGTGMQAFKFDRGSVKAGDAGRGRAVVDGKGGCARCHRIGEQGSRVAPDLSDIGAARSAGSLLRS